MSKKNQGQNEHRESERSHKEMEDDSAELFTMSWTFGLSSEVEVCNLSSKEKKAMLYVCGNAIVEYDWKEKNQVILHEHLNSISSIAVSEDMLWLASADIGIDNCLIIWDLCTKSAVKRFFDPYPEFGIRTLKFSYDNKYLVSISNEPIQEVAIWDWNADSDNMIDSVTLKEEYGRQHHITFHPLQSVHFVTTGITRTIFFQLIKPDNKLDHHSPLTRQTDLGSVCGQLTQTVFLKTSDIALTATSVGNIITWASGYEKLSSDVKILSPAKRKATRLIQSNYNHMSINVIDTVRDYIVTADDEGLINFYETNLELIFSFKKPEIGPITCISFSVDDLPVDMNSEEVRGYPLTATMAGSLFVVPNFIVSTSKGFCGYMDVKRLVFTKLRSVPPRLKYVIRAHPILPWLCIANSKGKIILWNHSTLEVDVDSNFPQPEEIECMTFDPLGVYLAIGYKGGLIQILDVPSLAYTKATKLQIGKRTIARMEFSNDGHYLAASDTSYSVLAYRLHYKPAEHRHLHESDTRWELLGLQQHHNSHIISILFMQCEDFAFPHLLSLGEDRKLVEYEFLGGNKLQLVSTHRIESLCTPLEMVWDPLSEFHLLIANSECKFRVYDIKQQKCRKTVLCPAQNIPLKRLKVLHHSVRGEHPPIPHLVYCTNKLLGISLLPVDGNQFKTLSVLAHSNGDHKGTSLGRHFTECRRVTGASEFFVPDAEDGIIIGRKVLTSTGQQFTDFSIKLARRCPRIIKISDVECSYDGVYVFSVGESDGCIFIWKMDTQVLFDLAESGGQDILPFYCMMPGGIDGDVLREMKNYFYYMHVRNKKRGFIDGWKASNTIFNNEVPDLMRALGYFPSKYEIDMMMDEIALDEEKKGDDKVCFDDVVKLYLNHRPVTGTQINDIMWAFDVISKDISDDISDGLLLREQLLDALFTRGDVMTELELLNILSDISLSLTPEKPKEMHIPSINDYIPREITLQLFLENILGYPMQQEFLSPQIYKEVAEYTQRYRDSVLSGKVTFNV